jgi:hypothetical protein
VACLKTIFRESFARMESAPRGRRQIQSRPEAV